MEEILLGNNMKNIKEYKTTSEWFSDARKEKYSIPLAMCHGLNIAQKELSLSFSEVFELFIRNKIIIESNHFYIYNMKGHLGITE